MQTVSFECFVPFILSDGVGEYLFRLHPGSFSVENISNSFFGNVADRKEQGLQ